MLSSGYALSPAYPNPFQDASSLDLTLPKSQDVRVAVYDMLGSEVAVLHEGTLAAHMQHVLHVDSITWPSGLYVVRAEGTTFTATQTLVVWK